MPQLKLQDFGGMIPARDLTLLPENSAAYSRNTWLYRGNIQGFKTPKLVHTLSGNSTAVYRIPLDDPYNYSNSVWVDLTDPDTNVIRAPVVKDQYKRYYFFGPSFIPSYSPLDEIQSGGGKLTLGVPAPTNPPTVIATPPALPTSTTTTTTVTDPTTNVETKTETKTPAILESRAYVYTWTTIYGEEGPPSPPVQVTAEAGSTYNVTTSSPDGSVTSGRRMSKINIYRTITDAVGYAKYYLVASVPDSQTLFFDDLLDATLVGGTQLQSEEWTPPPEDLQGCVALPNGILAAWTNDREVWFCEPYRPHAWPGSYTISVDYKIVGLGVLGTSLVIMTEGSPYIASGVTPGAMSLSRVSLHEPCLSRSSIISAPDGVFYASQNGLVSINPGNSQVVSSLLITRQDWNSLTPDAFAAARYGTAYLAFKKGGSFPSGDNGIVIDNALPNLNFSYLRLTGTISNGIQYEMTGSVFVVYNNGVYVWDSPDSTSQMPSVWRSKVFQFPFKQQFIAALVYFDLPTSVTIAAPTAAKRNTSQTQTFNAASQYMLLRVYADNRLVLVREIQATGEIIQIPSGFKGNFWQFEVEGQTIVSNIQVATSVKELGGV